MASFRSKATDVVITTFPDDQVYVTLFSETRTHIGLDALKDLRDTVNKAIESMVADGPQAEKAQAATKQETSSADQA